MTTFFSNCFMMQSKHTDQDCGSNFSSKYHQFIHLVLMSVPGSPRDMLGKKNQKRKKNSESMKGRIEHKRLKTNHSGY